LDLLFEADENEAEREELDDLFTRLSKGRNLLGKLERGGRGLSVRAESIRKIHKVIPRIREMERIGVVDWKVDRFPSFRVMFFAEASDRIILCLTTCEKCDVAK